MTSATRKTRVAIVGASGIGKHHAKWWALEGADVCAFAGTSAESVDRASEALRGLFAFTGRGYTGCETMLEKESPDIVDVCSPPSCHYGHCRRALEAGCHVLCEKPLTYDPGRTREELLAEAHELAALAQAAGKRFGVCTQYSVGARMFREMWSELRGGEEIVDCTGHLEAPARGRAPDPRRVWVDLSPHPISMLLELFPGGAVQWDSLERDFHGYEACARFAVKTPEGRSVNCSVITRNALTPPLNVRRCVLNGLEFHVEGVNDEQGIYRSRIVTAEAQAVKPDMMHLLVREFLQGRPATSAEAALANLDMMLRIMDFAG